MAIVGIDRGQLAKFGYIRFNSVRWNLNEHNRTMAPVVDDDDVNKIDGRCLWISDQFEWSVLAIAIRVFSSLFIAQLFISYIITDNMVAVGVCLCHVCMCDLLTHRKLPFQLTGDFLPDFKL